MTSSKMSDRRDSCKKSTLQAELKIKLDTVKIMVCSMRCLNDIVNNKWKVDEILNVHANLNIVWTLKFALNDHFVQNIFTAHGAISWYYKH